MRLSFDWSFRFLLFGLLVLLHFFLRWHGLHAEKHQHSDANDDSGWRLDPSLNVEWRLQLKVLLSSQWLHRVQVLDWISFPGGGIVSVVEDAGVLNLNKVLEVRKGVYVSVFDLLVIDRDNVSSVFKVRNLPLASLRVNESGVLSEVHEHLVVWSELKSLGRGHGLQLAAIFRSNAG